MNVSPFRISPEDLAGLDRKTLAGLQPLLDALNVTLGQVVQALSTIPSAPTVVPVLLTTGATVADGFPLVFRHGLSRRPVEVQLTNILPRDASHSLATPFVMQGWRLTDNGLVSIPAITGLLASNSYQLAFSVR